MQSILEPLMPIIVQIIGAALGLLLLWIGIQKQKLQAMQIGTEQRESIKTSMVTGAQAALFDGKTGDAALQATIEYVEAAKPAEIKATGMSRVVLAENAKAKVTEVATAVTAAENSNTVVPRATVADKLQ